MGFIKKNVLCSWRTYKKLRRNFNIFRFKISSRKPWSKGYFEYKWQNIARAGNDGSLLNAFNSHQKLPDGYGFGIDERIVEHPWLIGNLPDDSGTLLDAGSALNFECLLDNHKLKNKKITIVTLVPESNCFWRRGVSYSYEDLRALPFKDGQFDNVACISTLEHIGMDNSMIYSKEEKHREANKEDYIKAVVELKRVLKPGGWLFITVPFGKYQDWGFFQQFNPQMIQNVLNSFGGVSSSVDFYKYSKHGWQISDQESCSNAEYFNIRTDKKIDDDYTAAARAVACLQLKK